MRFQNSRVLVTGASRGIGLATARAFLKEGARVAINGRTETSTQKGMSELGGGPALVAAPGDIARVVGCEAVVEAALEGLGGLDVLVNNAGVFFRGSMEETDEEAWDRVLDANMKGTFFCSRAALPALKASKGNIVNVASESGIRGYGYTTAYCASKGAVVNLTRSMAMELAPDIRVNSVCPGVIETDMARDGFAINGDQDAGMRQQADQYPVKRIGHVDEVASAILYLASDAAGFINGVALPIEGGATVGA